MKLLLTSELILEWENSRAKIYYWDAEACPEYYAMNHTVYSV